MSPALLHIASAFQMSRKAQLPELPPLLVRPLQLLLPFSRCASRKPHPGLSDLQRVNLGSILRNGSEGVNAVTGSRSRANRIRSVRSQTEIRGEIVRIRSSLNQAARRYRWCSPPSTGSDTTMPRSGGSMFRGSGELPSSEECGRDSL